ncbi:MAG: ABC transporter permease [Propionibacteriaceae bacterium]|jgi:NitT/TauT family transport system permease protein|nr:ABC transporter permease [Propionibacteriaceae bacterium]
MSLHTSVARRDLDSPTALTRQSGASTPSCPSGGAAASPRDAASLRDAAPPAPRDPAPRFHAAAVGKFLLDKGVATLALLLVIWEVGARLVDKPVFLPGVVETARGAWTLILNGTLLDFTLVSYGRIFAGWTIAILVAVPVGLVVGQFQLVRRLMEPFINFFRFVPAIAFLTLFLMWFGAGETPRVMLIIYACCFPILINTIAGVQAISPTFVQVAQSQGASRAQIFLTVTVPASIPQVFVGLRLALGGAMVSIVAAEMLCAQNGLGYMIYTSRIYFETDWIFVGVLTLGLSGYVFDRLLRFIGGKALRHHGVKNI